MVAMMVGLKDAMMVDGMVVTLGMLDLKSVAMKGD